MIAAFRERFPGVPIEQNTVRLEFFSRTFNGVLAWVCCSCSTRQRKLVIEKVARALEPQGRFSLPLPGAS